MKITVDISSAEVREAVAEYIKNIAGVNSTESLSMDIQVRSKQNYKDKEWESGEIRVVFI